jgi:hypothetical protein
MNFNIDLIYVLKPKLSIGLSKFSLSLGLIKVYLTLAYI